MTVSHSWHPAVSVVVDPGPSPYPAPWDLEVHGPLDPAVLERALGELVTGDPDRPAGQHRLVRHGPDHHTLRLTPADGVPAAAVASWASQVGRVADLLTEPPPGDQPLTPAQCAVLARGAGRRYEAVFVEPAVPLDVGTVREAVRTVVTTHPQLRPRTDAAGRPSAGEPEGGSGGPGSRQDPVVEGEFTDEAGFTAAVASVGRTADRGDGLPLRVLLARDRRPAGPRADRLAVVADELAVDEASWHILLGDLTTALGDLTASPGESAPEAFVRPRPVPDVPAGAHGTPGAPGIPGAPADGVGAWVGQLRELAGDPEELRHWGLIAERRARMASSRWSARVSQPGDVVGPGPSDAWDRGRGAAGRHIGFVVEAGPTGRIVQGLAGRLALTAGQVLTGVFTLALARWQRVDEVSLDVRGDPRTDHPGLRRHVGRLTDVYPVQLALAPGLDPLEQLASLAGPLAAGAGHAAGGAGFGACREWCPDPLLRDALRELPPAQACLTLLGPDEPPAGGLHRQPVPGRRFAPSPHRLHARAQVVGGRLHIGLDWMPGPAEGITDVSVAAFGDLLRELLGELAEASTAPIPAVFRATPQQSSLYTGGDARPGMGRHVEQLMWTWRGPLDLERFTKAWQSLYDRETVLRTAFIGGPEPQLMVHSRVTPDIISRFHHGDLSSFLESDRQRGFDLRCPGALRLTLLETEGAPSADSASPTRIVLTYHRALLDNWSVHILLREFYRAYLAGGVLPGGERRPDLRDYTAWVAAQDLGPARGFWTRSAPPHGAASSPGRPAGPTGLTGVGRSRLLLEPAETVRLMRWAGMWGFTESSVLQAVWALLIYRASGATAPAPVCFAVTVPGRGIPLEGASRVLGPLRNSLPVSVEVDPAATVPGLLRQLRDRALELAAYEWVPSDWIEAWDQRGGGADAADTVIVFEDPPHPVEGLEGELTAQGIRAEFLGTVPARSVLPIGLLAHHDPEGGLVLTGVYDRDVLDEEAASELLVQSALLLRELPLWARESTTVAEVLKLLEGREVPPMAEASGTGRSTSLLTLRAAEKEQAGTICLIPPPGAPGTCYDLLARLHQGPHELLVLTSGTDEAKVPDAADASDAARSALVELSGSAAGRPLVLGGFSGAGALACDLARHLAADCCHPPRVVIAGAADERQRAHDLARALADAIAPDA